MRTSSNQWRYKTKKEGQSQGRRLCTSHLKKSGTIRKWCPFCIQGKCKSGAHVRTDKSEEEKEQEVPVISLDYMGPKSKEKDKSKEANSGGSLPILGGTDRKSKMCFAHMVPKKGHDAHAIKIVERLYPLLVFCLDRIGQVNIDNLLHDAYLFLRFHGNYFLTKSPSSSTPLSLVISIYN